MVIGAYTHFGHGARIRAHEGTVRIGAKTVIGIRNTVNGYLDIRIGDACLLGDDVYICDFDHRTEDSSVPIKDQGLVKSPVRIGDDVWIGTKVTVPAGHRHRLRARSWRRAPWPGAPTRRAPSSAACRPGCCARASPAADGDVPGGPGVQPGERSGRCAAWRCASARAPSASPSSTSEASRWKSSRWPLGPAPGVVDRLVAGDHERPVAAERVEQGAQQLVEVGAPRRRGGRRRARRPSADEPAPLQRTRCPRRSRTPAGRPTPRSPCPRPTSPAPSSSGPATWPSARARSRVVTWTPAARRARTAWPRNAGPSCHQWPNSSVSYAATTRPGRPRSRCSRCSRSRTAATNERDVAAHLRRRGVRVVRRLGRRGHVRSGDRPTGGRRWTARGRGSRGSAAAVG